MENAVSNFKIITNAKQQSRNMLIHNMTDQSKSHFKLGMNFNPFDKSISPQRAIKTGIELSKDNTPFK